MSTLAGTRVARAKPRFQAGHAEPARGTIPEPGAVVGSLSCEAGLWRLSWFDKARTWSGGNSYQKFLTNTSDDAFANATDTERLAVEALGLRKAYVAPALPRPTGPGRDYSTEEVLKLAPEKLKGRNFENGKKMFAAARCVVCHRYGCDGGPTDPVLTQLESRVNLKRQTLGSGDPDWWWQGPYRTWCQRLTRFIDDGG